jgi:hypothetical protein
MRSHNNAKDTLLKLYEIPEKPEEYRILETKIDPLEWKQEVERVFRHLESIEKEVEIALKQGSSNEGGFEEYRRHLDLILEMCEDIRESCH